MCSFFISAPASAPNLLHLRLHTSSINYTLLMAVIKHSPSTAVPTKIERETTFLVKAATPYVAAIKRIDAILAKFDKSPIDHKKYQRGEYKKVKYIRVKGMGRAIDKTVSLALHYQTKKSYKVDLYTGTVEVVDEITAASNHKSKDGDSDEESTFKTRDASFVEVKIWLKRES